MPLSEILQESWKFERTIALQSSLLAGASIDPDTLAWWQRQSSEARIAVSTNTVTLRQTLDDFTQWFEETTSTEVPIRLWANSPSFDAVVLESAYRSLDRTPPWNFRHLRDQRTILDMAAELTGWKRDSKHTAHTALADAIAQAAEVREAYGALRNIRMITVSEPGGYDNAAPR
jgi:hypothetical protein